MYIDDIVVHGVEIQEVWEHTKAVLVELARAGFMINMRKCKFLVNRVKIVGQEVEA